MGLSGQQSDVMGEGAMLRDRRSIPFATALGLGRGEIFNAIAISNITTPAHDSLSGAVAVMPAAAK